MTRLPLAVAVALAAGGALILSAGCSSKPKPAEVKVYAAANLREPLTELAPAFDKQIAPATVSFDYDGTGNLLGKLKTIYGVPEFRPDVFIAAEESFAHDAEKLGLIDRLVPVVYQQPVLAVSNKSKEDINSLADLAKPSVKVALGDNRGPAIGKISDLVLERAGVADVRKKAANPGSTVQDIANAIKLGQVDAGIIWDTTAVQAAYKNVLRVVAIPDAPLVPVLACRVAKCPHPDLADAYIQFLTSEPARQTFSKYGFTPAGTQPATRPDP